MSLPSETITLADGSMVTMGMRDGQLKLHASQPDLTKNAGAIPQPTDDGAAIATQLGLGTLGTADAKLLSDMIAKVRT